MAITPDPEQRLALLDGVVEALAHPARRQILMTIHFRGGRMSSGDIAGRFAHSWPTTTRHLQVLASAQLLRTSRNGRERIYEIDRDKLALLRDWLGWFFNEEGKAA